MMLLAPFAFTALRAQSARSTSVSHEQPGDVPCKLFQLAPVANPRPSKWEIPLNKEGHPGLNNLFEVVPRVLYRGSQPFIDRSTGANGWRELEKMGIKTVVSLRMLHRDVLPNGSTLHVLRIGSNPWHPEDEDLAAFLKIATDASRQPVFVHCQRGVDRTGTAIAIYRMAVQGWSADEAIDEMIRGGSLFDCVWLDNPKYLKHVDIGRIKRLAGLQGH